ncbi:hypothetical protein I4U23_020424 [Adineta vaga]|nr:hypothetical protein I4U23_020424 [Adineta vaga]
MSTHFDHLPVEILHMVFQYMSNNDVIRSFYNLSSYLNAVLNQYCLHTLNFQSTSKSCFDFLCDHLELSRILSLTLSDDIHTPYQVQLFFNRFKLRDFINLQSLRLLSITNEDIYLIRSDLSELRYLTSLFTSSRLSQTLLLGKILNQMKVLNNLSISYGDIFDHSVTFPLHNLKILDAGICNFLELRRLKRIVPSLISLKIILQANHQLNLVSDINIWTQLERLDLTLKDEALTTFDEIEQLLSHFHNLTSLTLNIRGSVNQLANGKRWETCSTIISLKNFNFIFEFEHPLLDTSPELHDILQSFSTSFWLDLKKWFVIITNNRVYTITCFDNQLFHSSTHPPLSTSPDDQWFYSKVKRINIDKNTSFNNLHRFHKVEKLDLIEESIFFLSIPNINQFVYLHYLILHQSISSAIISRILRTSSHINHLTLSEFDYDERFRFQTIHNLHLQESIRILNRTQIKLLSRIFPSIKHLSIYINSIQLIYSIIDHFHHLENVIFRFQKFIKPILQELLKDHTHLGNNTSSFTCRTEENIFSVWISNLNLPAVHVKMKSVETLNMVHETRSKKCLIQ